MDSTIINQVQASTMVRIEGGEHTDNGQGRCATKTLFKVAMKSRRIYNESL